MATVETDDGVQLYYEEAGDGTPMVFVHEFAGDHRSFEPQMRYFARRFRCIAYNARGYPPSEVPDAVARYSQDRARDDILAVLDGLSVERAHIVGVSMGALAALHFGLHYPDRARSLVLGGCGYGALSGEQEQFRSESASFAQRIESEGMSNVATEYGSGPSRVQFENKDPRGFAEFVAMLAQHSSLGSANTLRGVQMNRPSIYDLEEPDRFNRLVDDFVHQVDAGRWQLRDPRSIAQSILSQK